jgi:hypothetical protein
MTPGEEHVLRTMELCRAIAAEVAALGALDQEWRSAIGERLGRIEGTLSQVKERFILKSKVCLPFAARCEEHARALEGGLPSLTMGTSSQDAVSAFSGALDALDKAVRTLDERTDMRGMAIT